LGKYTLVAKVADGAMGRVYEGRHPDTKARVAVKVLHDTVARDHIAVERFKREYETARELDSPYIVRVLEFGETPDGSYFMTMEYLEGLELSKAVAQRKPLSFARTVRTVSQIALGLEHAHSFGFIHRDLKPDNIFFCDTPDGIQVRLLDFGSVKLQVETGKKLTALGTTLGSPYYMSPEQAMGATDVDQRSDVFALAAILYEMLTAKTAFEASTVAQILMRILNHSPAPPSTLNPASTAAIDGVVDKGLRKDKHSRYDSARALAEGLIAAVGLKGTAETWAQKSEPDIAQALSAARKPSTSPPPRPDSVRPPRSTPPPSAAPAPRSVPPVSAAPRVVETLAAAARIVEPLTDSPRARSPEPHPDPESVRPPRSASSVPAPRRTHHPSDAPLTVPMQTAKTKWIVVGAVALLLIAGLWLVVH
jgi:serine/threonine-protein kinase